MARARDVLLDLCGAICVAVLAGARPQQNLMPPALEICDWNLVIDALMRWALCSLPDFIRALTDIKRSRRERLADIIFVFTLQGFGPTAQMITEGPFPYFAQLRWGTLESLSGCGRHVLIHSSIVQPAVMHRQTLVQLVRQSFANPRFTHQLAFVTWLSAWLRALQRCERVMLLQCAGTP